VNATELMDLFGRLLPGALFRLTASQSNPELGDTTLQPLLKIKIPKTTSRQFTMDYIS